MVFSLYRELLAAIERIMIKNPIDTLHAIFESLMEKLEWVSQSNDDEDP
jgi:hypothetical protein